jgi:hypothetical protein
MTDFVLVVALLAFFGVCVLYIRACERIMGPDEGVDTGPSEADAMATDEHEPAAEVLATR